jgi:hypothetical protein
MRCLSMVLMGGPSLRHPFAQGVQSARSIADEPRSGDGNLRSDSSTNETPEETQSPSMPLAVIIKAGTSLALLLAVASAGLALFFLFTSLPGARPHREVAAQQHSCPSRWKTAQRIRNDGSAASGSCLSPNSTKLSNDTEKFVPVVFTHKDRGTALRAFAELQRRYSKLMALRQSELQMVDTGKNGIWYRLVVLPAGSHQEASETCGRMQAAGYSRCWIKVC